MEGWAEAKRRPNMGACCVVVCNIAASLWKLTRTLCVVVGPSPRRRGENFCALRFAVSLWATHSALVGNLSSIEDARRF